MFELALFVKWGSGPAEATPRFEDVVAGGRQARPPNRKRAAPVVLRLDAQGGFHLYSPGDRAILSFRGAFAGRTPLVLSDGELVDFAAGAERFYVLVRSGAGGVTLTSVDRAGAVQWRRDGLDSAVDRVVLTSAALFLGARLKPERLVQLDLKTGATVGEQALEHVAMRPFAAPDGALVSATYFPKENRRGVLVYQPEGGRESAAVADAVLYGPLTQAIGTNAAHDLYVFGQGLNEAWPSLIAVGADAKERKRVALAALLVAGPGRPVISAHFAGSELQLSLNGQPKRVELPARLREHLPSRLVLVDADAERAVFDLRDQVGYSADRVALRFATGALEEVNTGGAALVPGLQSAETWQVGADGRIYAVVTSEEGVTVVAIDLS